MRWTPDRCQSPSAGSAGLQHSFHQRCLHCYIYPSVKLLSASHPCCHPRVGVREAGKGKQDSIYILVSILLVTMLMSSLEFLACMCMHSLSRSLRCAQHRYDRLIKRSWSLGVSHPKVWGVALYVDVAYRGVWVLGCLKVHMDHPG